MKIISKTSLFYGLLILAITVTSCNFVYNSVSGEGELVKENRDVKNFTGIELDLSGNVYFSTSDQTTVTVESQSNLFEYIITEVDDGVLEIGTRPNTSITTNKGINIYITAPKLDMLAINGSGYILIEDQLVTEDLTCEISGSGDIALTELIATDLEAEISGSGSLQVGVGKVTNSEYEINGSGEINTRNVITDNVEVEINGSGDATVHAIDHLEISISGSGDVLYEGQPELDLDLAGSGGAKHI